LKEESTCCQCCNEQNRKRSDKKGYGSHEFLQRVE